MLNNLTRNLKLNLTRWCVYPAGGLGGELECAMFALQTSKKGSFQLFEGFHNSAFSFWYSNDVESRYLLSISRSSELCELSDLALDPHTLDENAWEGFLYSHSLMWKLSAVFKYRWISDFDRLITFLCVFENYNFKFSTRFSFCERQTSWVHIN